MPRPYSIDLRERVIDAAAEGQSVRAVGEIFDVSPSFVAKLTQRWRRSGRIDPLMSGGDRRCGAIDVQRDWLLQTTEEPLREGRLVAVADAAPLVRGTAWYLVAAADRADDPPFAAFARWLLAEADGPML